MAKCEVCGKPVNVKKNHVYWYYTDIETGIRSKRKTYEHTECANLVDKS